MLPHSIFIHDFCLFGDRVSLSTDWSRTHYVVEVGLELLVLLPLLPSTYQVLGFLWTSPYFEGGDDFKMYYLFILVVLGIIQGASHMQGKHATNWAVAPGYTHTFTYCEFGYPRPIGIAVYSFWFGLHHSPCLISADGESIL